LVRHVASACLDSGIDALDTRIAAGLTRTTRCFTPRRDVASAAARRHNRRSARTTTHNAPTHNTSATMSSGIVCADEVGQKYEQMKIRKTASFMVMKIQNDQVEVRTTIAATGGIRPKGLRIRSRRRYWSKGCSRAAACRELAVCAYGRPKPLANLKPLSHPRRSSRRARRRETTVACSRSWSGLARAIASMSAATP